MKKTGLIFLFQVVITGSALAQSGVPDATFGSSGITITDINGNDDAARNMLLQPDGKIIVGGYTDIGTDEDFLLVRYLADGSLDNSFGTSGKVITHISDGNDVIRGLALQSDGKIMAVGYAGVTNEFLSIVRYNSNGSLDNSFAANGMDSLLIYDNPGSDRTVPNDVKIQADGKILVAGFTKNSAGDLNCMVVRYDANGTLDATYGIGGKVVTPLGPGEAQWEHIAIQPDGKVVVVGYYNNGGPNNTMAIARYDQFGGLDNGFANNGIAVQAVASGNNEAYSVVIQPNNHILVGGVAPNGNDVDFVLIRLEVNGALDNTFGSSGIVITELGNNVDDYLTQIELQPDGKILACGASFNTTNDLALVRYQADGSLDTSFGPGNNGIVTGSYPAADEIAFALSLQPDGKVLLAGGYDGDVFVTRYNNTAVGIEESKAGWDNQLVYPNPAKDYITLNSQDYTLKQVDFYAVSGELIKHVITGSKRLAIADLPAGIYLVRVVTSESSSCIKWIKE
ncbi:MAG: T9SS type A sorting domain-containing protein [Flavobacteriales bacterium]|nr:T9SS type A sorting domain-containing protein [Flavobacteriales bacterium]